MIYPGRPYARTHPDHLATLARAHGLAHADPDGCHVLELACGDGMNVVAMAAAVPGMTVTGVDVDEAAIARGRAVVEALGIGDRVELHVADLRDPLALDPADYVVCHGLYTWVAPRVADAALEALARHLAPHGVGFLSFNLEPGWTIRRALGPAIARRAGDAAGARELLDALEPLDERVDAYGRLLADERRRLMAIDDPLLVHDDLGPRTGAVWHGDVVAHLDHHGLRVLRDAHPEAEPVADPELADLAWGPPYREVAIVHATAPAGAQTAAKLSARPRRHALEPGERPLAFPLARLQASRGEEEVTTLRHTTLRIQDAGGRALLALCDGTRDRNELAAATGVASVEEALSRLAEHALLLAAPRSPAA